MKRFGGFTIIQIMVTLFVAGIVGWAIVNAIIDNRCEQDPARPMCVERAAKHSE